MRRLFIFLTVILLSGCVPHTELKPMPEFAKKYNTSSLLSDAYKSQREYIKCMEDYGKANAGSSTTASEIAVEATGSCNTALWYYESNRRYYYAFASIDKGERYEYYSENNKYKLQNDVDQLISEGKRATISEVVKLRAKKPSNNMNN